MKNYSNVKIQYFSIVHIVANNSKEFTTPFSGIYKSTCNDQAIQIGLA